MENTSEEKRKSIINKIQALLNKTTEKGCTEEEALSAATLAGKLMNDYNITHNDFTAQEEKYVEDKIDTWSNAKSVMHTIVWAIAFYTDTKAWYNTDAEYNLITYKFFGQEYDVMIAKYIYSIIRSAYHFELDKFKKSEGYKNNKTNAQTKIASWNVGFADRMSERLSEVKFRFKTENKEAGIVLYDKTKIITQKLAELGYKFKNESGSAKSIKDKSSFDQGRESANNVQINNGVSHKQSSNFLK